MTYETDLRKINQMVKGLMKFNEEPTQEEIISWCKQSYINGRIAMGEDPSDYEFG